jgi:glycosyltransferase involved in cell wall biosynthesis
MERLRVLVVASWFPSPRKPVLGTFIATQARALADHHDVAVIVPSIRPLRQLLSEGPPLNGTRSLGSVPVVYSGAIVLRQSDTAKIAAAGSRRVRRAVGRLSSEWRRPDVIHAHVVLPGGYAALELGRELRIPVVVTEHSGPFSMHTRDAEGERLTRHVIRGADRVIAVSPALAAEIQAFEPVQVEVVGNVIDRVFGSVQLPTLTRRGETRFAFVGLMTEVKGLDVLLDALQRADRAGASAWRLRLVGDGPLRQPMEREAKRAGLADRCEFLGLTTIAGVRDTLEWADFLVAPSRHETFGMAAAEALAAGRGVIGTAVGGLSYVVEEGLGRLVPPGDAIALASALQDAITGALRVDPPAARASMERRFSPDSVVSALTEVYKDVIETHRPWSM